MSRIFALADLHLAIAVPEKTMEVFGWTDYMNKIQQSWQDNVKPEDLILLPGDISWAMDLKEGLIDLSWIDALPGTKLLIKGNHDYWWASYTKLQKALPPTLHALQNNAFHWKDFTFAGARLWDTNEYNFGPTLDEDEAPPSSPEEIEAAERVYVRELHRLEMSLLQLSKAAKHRIALTHYPPIGLDLRPSRASNLLEKYGIETCVFGHLHGMPKEPLFGKAGGVNYVFCAADYLDFCPVPVM